MGPGPGLRLHTSIQVVTVLGPALCIEVGTTSLVVRGTAAAVITPFRTSESLTSLGVIVPGTTAVERQRDRETERQRDRLGETERQRDRETERQRDRVSAERQRDTGRETERQSTRLD